MDRRSFLATGAALGVMGTGRVASGGWNAAAAMPWPAQEIYAAATGTRIFTAGGLVARQGEPLHIERRVAILDTTTGTWSEGPMLPQPRHHPMMVADGAGRVLAIGGYRRGEGGEWTNSLETWVLEGDSWSSLDPLPRPQAEAVGALVAGRVHLVSGRSPIAAANGNWPDQGDVDTHLALDPATGRWETRAPAPMARNSAAAAVLDDALWVAGGRTVRGGGTGRLDRYDPAADRWDTLAPIPVSDSGQQVGGGLAMGALGGKLVAFGGEWFAPGGGGVFPETWIYDPAADAWTRGPDMITPRHGLAAAVVGDRLYAIAGGEVVSGGKAGATVEVFEF